MKCGIEITIQMISFCRCYASMNMNKRCTCRSRHYMTQLIMCRRQKAIVSFKVRSPFVFAVHFTLTYHSICLHLINEWKVTNRLFLASWTSANWNSRKQNRDTPHRVVRKGAKWHSVCVCLNSALFNYRDPLCVYKCTWNPDLLLLFTEA